MLMPEIQAATQTMRQIAKQAYVLATGLQNAAPPGTSLQSVHYLLETAAQLEQACSEVEKLLQTGSP